MLKTNYESNACLLLETDLRWLLWRLGPLRRALKSGLWPVMFQGIEGSGSRGEHIFDDSCSRHSAKIAGEFSTDDHKRRGVFNLVEGSECCKPF